MSSPDWSNGDVRTFFVLAILFAVLSLLSVIARFVSVRIQRRQLAVDDWLVAAALVFFYIQLAVHLWGLWEGGIYEHMENVSRGQIIVLFKQLTVVQFPYPCVLALTRISICILLLRIFVQKWIRRAVYFAIVLNIAWWLFLVIDAFVICRPFAFNWNPNIPNGHCGNKNASYIANAIWGIFNDVVIWSLPHFVVWNLRTTRAQKLALSGVFLLGILDIVVSIVRITTLVALDINGDFTYSMGPAEILSFVECGVAIMVTCAVVCRPLFELALPRRLRSSERRDSGAPIHQKSTSQNSEEKYRKCSLRLSGPYTAMVSAKTSQNTEEVNWDCKEATAANILVTRDVSVAQNVSESEFEEHV